MSCIRWAYFSVCVGYLGGWVTQSERTFSHNNKSTTLRSQVSDEAKQQVSAQAMAEAARMGKTALEARLREIGMSQGDWALYEGILARVGPQIQQLRQV